MDERRELGVAHECDGRTRPEAERRRVGAHVRRREPGRLATNFVDERLVAANVRSHDDDGVAT